MNGDPDRILLDLNLPRMDGREVRSRIKRDGSLKLTPTVLTTSSAKEDIVWNSGLHANWYLIEPMKFDELDDLARNSRDFWPTLARLPQHQRSQ
jgi:two-component system, chemotaxis family, response regulator Rcp1